ncbi:MaoC family dehydratase [Haloarcula laminariae]|uniref:MaoC family dehydratase n=1 Tax=Haloarcula laminariae TaxID=2961577 RepID=UPI0021C64C13|nr:MaoC family dehydratase [Halomicroarcula laminariae]
MRFYEDISVGDRQTSDGYRISKEEITEFGEKYDPQPFHTDEEAAKSSVFGGLVASGWQTAAICMRLHVQSNEDTATQAGLGVDELRWHRPLRPGDELRLRTEILDKRPSESNPNRGIVTTGHEGLNQDDDLVVSYEATALVQRRADSSE